MHLPPELRRIALNNDGVITAADVRSAGLSRPAVRRRVTCGAWVSQGRGIYTLADHPITARTKARLAVHKTGPNAVLSGLSAVWWQGLADNPSTITVTAPRHSHGREVEGVRVRYRDLDDAEVIVRSDLRVTTLALSVLEAAIEESVSVVDNALLRRRVSLQQLNAAAAR
ncbi:MULTISPECIES: type IV toxin-antitoxin system AbiEi family antitoxin domain-containing protein [Gordonia]|uniref:AbiEi antitoxin N-terminal domain-containing protein n=1 Tax=Gordonia amicalis TaxID=89053 RepID=A0AAE4R3F4_9ACTN|nr:MULTISPECIES: type IV toxin-antitoxin system AbiEi family antitoxin domain-containing protein [Gordonia]MDV6306890.1 hypothetical protein [Gordonia amicalis]MDV6311082.1 hypothetical protein [Gordonia amicalis]MDV7078654.1 hypothetical protein [Gordonia amicalis]